MKKKVISAFVLATFLLMDFKMFASPASEGDGEGGPEGGDNPPLPINGKLIYLAIAGVLFASWMYRRHKAAKA